MLRTYRAATAGSQAQVAKFNPVPFGCVLRKVEGYYNGSAPVYLHFFDSMTEPNPTITVGGMSGCLYTVQLFANDGFVFSFEFTGLQFKNSPWLVLSSTELGYTAIGGGGLMDIIVQLEQTELVLYTNPYEVSAPLGTSVYAIAGDFSTPIDSLQVWATANGPKRLHRIDWANGLGGAIPAWLMLFTNDSPANGDKPFRVFQPVDDGTTSDLHSLCFGDASGIIPMGSASAGAVQTKGCTLWVSTTGDVLTKSVASAAVIRAIYSAV